jgi:hypothetical protein
MLQTAGGFSCIDIKYPNGPGIVGTDVDLVGHNFRGTTKDKELPQATADIGNQFQSLD